MENWITFRGGKVPPPLQNLRTHLKYHQIRAQGNWCQLWPTRWAVQIASFKISVNHTSSDPPSARKLLLNYAAAVDDKGPSLQFPPQSSEWLVSGKFHHRETRKANETRPQCLLGAPALGLWIITWLNNYKWWYLRVSGFDPTDSSSVHNLDKRWRENYAEW